MPDTDHRPNVPDLPPEDKMGFAVPKTPAHSLMLLNRYMRTDMLQHIHVRLHKMRDENEPGSPLHHMAKSLEQVIGTWDGINLVECFTALSLARAAQCARSPPVCHAVTRSEMSS